MPKKTYPLLDGNALSFIMKSHALSVPDVCRITSCIEDDVCRMLNNDPRLRSVVARRVSDILGEYDAQNIAVWAPAGFWTTRQLREWMSGWKISSTEVAEVMEVRLLDVMRMRRGSIPIPPHLVDRAVAFAGLTAWTSRKADLNLPKPSIKPEHHLIRYAGDDRH